MTQAMGFSARIAVNNQVATDLEKLVVFSTSPVTGAGDPTRPLDLIDRLTNSERSFSPSAGLGSEQNPLNGTIDSFARRIVSFQGQQAAYAERDVTAQDLVTSSLKDRRDAASGVSIDEEMAQLLLLQNAYAANARVMSVIKELSDILLSIGR